jgi:hypothetical protein
MARKPARKHPPRRSSPRPGKASLIANPVPWPNGARCAVAITFDIDTDSFLHLEHGEMPYYDGAIPELRDAAE